MTPKLQPLLDAAAKALPGCPLCNAPGELLPDWGEHDRKVKHPADHRKPWERCPLAGNIIELHWWSRAPSSLELRLREYVGELEAECADKGIAQPIAAAIRREIADRLESLMDGKP